MKTKNWPVHGWIGLGLIVLFWLLNWLLTGLRTHWGFFPLWLGYCLFIDAIVFWREGTSMLSRSRKAYVTLFLVSAPVWWLFEVLNWRTQNWHYDGREFFSDLEYLVMATLSFSTVMPAVFSTAELASTFRWLKRSSRGFRIVPTRSVQVGAFIAGCLMLLSLLLWPRYGFPFIWLSVYFIFEPINIRLKHRTLARHVAKGDWRPVLALWTGCIICSFFWEMWNFYSYPKWIYTIPFVDFWHVFEMPLLGYGGYLPFSMELYAIYGLVMGSLARHGVEIFHPLKVGAKPLAAALQN